MNLSCITSLSPSVSSSSLWNPLQPILCSCSSFSSFQPGRIGADTSWEKMRGGGGDLNLRLFLLPLQQSVGNVQEGEWETCYLSFAIMRGHLLSLTSSLLCMCSAFHSHLRLCCVIWWLKWGYTTFINGHLWAELVVLPPWSEHVPRRLWVRRQQLCRHGNFFSLDFSSVLPSHHGAHGKQVNVLKACALPVRRDTKELISFVIVESHCASVALSDFFL